MHIGHLVLLSLSVASGCGVAAEAEESHDGELIPERTTEDAFFGTAVAASGDDVIVGAPGEADPFANVGAAYVFHRLKGKVWDKGFRLQSPHGINACSFGSSVAISGDFAAVSLQGGAVCGVPGTVYVFRRIGSDNRWDLANPAELLSPTPFPEDRFGTKIALDGDTLVVSTPLRFVDPGSGVADVAPCYDPMKCSDYVGGPVSVFRRNGPDNLWLREAVLTPEGGYRADESFDSALALSGDDLAVGADDNGTSSTTTATYLYRRTGKAWAQTDRIQCPVSADLDFGEAVGLGAQTLVVGAADGILSDGTAWQYERDATGVWASPQVLAPLAGERIENGHVGRAVATDGATTLVGMPGVGAVRMAQKSDAGWSITGWFEPSRTRKYGQLGSAVAVSGVTLVVADNYDQHRARNCGAVFVY